MLDVSQLRELVVKPALEPLGLWSEVAENLIVGTAIQESALYFLKQEKGPALGIYQIEPQTYDWLRGVISTHRLLRSILSVCSLSHLPSNPSVLVWHLLYATIVCRFRYLVVKEPLPETHNIQKLAKYYKKYYNTESGDATVESFVRNYNTYNQRSSDA